MQDLIHLHYPIHFQAVPVTSAPSWWHPLQDRALCQQVHFAFSTHRTTHHPARIKKDNSELCEHHARRRGNLLHRVESDNIRTNLVYSNFVFIHACMPELQNLLTRCFANWLPALIHCAIGSVIQWQCFFFPRSSLAWASWVSLLWKSHLIMTNF